MGLFKKITKAIKKVTNAPLKAIAKGAGLDNQAPAQTTATTEAAAPENEVAKPDVDDADSGADTASTKKKANSGGKRSLSVTRSSGAGLNV